MTIKYSIQFGLKTSKTPADLHEVQRDFPIRARVSYLRNRVDIPIKLGCPDNIWDYNKQLVKSGAQNCKGISSADINSEISSYRQIIADIIKSYELQNVIPAPDMLRAAIISAREKKVINFLPEKSRKAKIWEVFQAFMSEEGAKQSWADNQYDKFNSLKTDLINFRPNITFEDLDETCLTEFVTYLREKKKLNTPRKKKGAREEYDHDDIIGIKNSTIEKKLEYLRWFLRWAQKKHYHNNDTFETFRPKLKKTNNSVVFLTPDEIKRLYQFKIPATRPGLERARDILVFGCFTGLRYSDIANLKKNDINGGIIDVTTIKTDDTLRIEYNAVSQKIIEKYKDIPFENNLALPVISNQKMNQALKELMELAGFDEPIRRVSFRGNERIEELKPKYSLITTHVGRRSFICNCLAAGIPVNVVMKWTGHSDYDAMKPYIDVADEIRSKEMKKLNLTEISSLI